MLTRQGIVFHFRRVVPARLRPLIGKREWWASLCTASATLARARAGLLYAAAEEVIEMAKQAADAQEELARLQQANIDEMEQIIALQREAAEKQKKLNELKVLMAEATAWTEVNERLKPLKDATEKLSCVPAAIARLGGQRDEARRTVQEAIRLQASSQMPPPPASAAPKEPISDLVEPYFAIRLTVNSSTNQVIGQDRGTLRRFIEICGDRPAAEYGRADITRFLSTMRCMPAVYGRSPKDKDASIADLIARAERSGGKRLSDKTVKRHKSAIAQFLQFAVDHGHLTVSAHTDLLGKHRFRTEEGARDQRDVWTPEELKALFGSPIWTGCHPYFRAEAGNEIIRDAKFWLPLLALFQGARLEEFADLYRRDVICDNGIWAVNITPSVADLAGAAAEGEKTAGKHKRRLKTANAKRTVALHPEIIKIGFIAYVEATAPNPADPLFPDIEPQGKDGKRGPRITRWFGEYRKKLNLFRPGVAMHAFRHGANTRLRDMITDWQQERHLNYMFGHATGAGQGAERYDKGPGLTAAAATLALLRYPEIDLSHLRKETGAAKGKRASE